MDGVIDGIAIYGYLCVACRTRLVIAGLRIIYLRGDIRSGGAGLDPYILPVSPRKGMTIVMSVVDATIYPKRSGGMAGDIGVKRSVR